MKNIRYYLLSLALTGCLVGCESLLDEEPKIVDTPEVIEKYGTVLEPKKENY